MRLILGFLSLLLCLLGGVVAPPPPLAAEVVDRIVAWVNDDIITLSELNEKTEAFVAERKQNPFVRDEDLPLGQIRRKILENLINQRLTAREISRLKISVSAVEVDEVLATIRRENRLTQEALEAQLRKDGRTFEDLRQSIREDLERTRLINREVRNKTVITDEQVEAYYQSHQEEFQGKARRFLQSIFLPIDPEASPPERSQLYALAEQIANRLHQGADFAGLARRYSRGPGADTGGDLGFFSQGELDPVLEAAVEDLEPGGISQVIATHRGLHIIRVSEVDRTPAQPLEEIRESIRRRLFQEEINRKYLEWLNNLRERSYVKVDY